MSEHKCEGNVWDGMFSARCGKTARYEHEGRWYCKTHHPPTAQAKRDARSKKWREDLESRQQAMREADEARAEMQRKAAAYDGLIAQRDALLEALKRAADFLHHATEFRFGHPGFEQTHAKARAAIKKAEEGK